MNYRILNAEHTLLIEKSGCAQKNGYLTSLIATDAAPVRLTELASGKTVLLTDTPPFGARGGGTFGFGLRPAAAPAEGLINGGMAAPAEGVRNEPTEGRKEFASAPAQRQAAVQCWISRTETFVYLPPTPPKLPFLRFVGDPSSSFALPHLSNEGFIVFPKGEVTLPAPYPYFVHVPQAAQGRGERQSEQSKNAPWQKSQSREKIFQAEQGKGEWQAEQGENPFSQTARNGADVYAFFATEAAARAFLCQKSPTRCETPCTLLLAADRPLFCTQADAFKVENDRLFCERYLPTHRRHRAQTEHDLQTGRLLFYHARATRHESVSSLPPLLFLPVFLEEVLCRAAVVDFLCERLKPRAASLCAFLGDFCRILPESENTALILTEEGRVRRVEICKEDGLVSSIEQELL